MKQTLNLTPDLDLYQKLELRISNLHVRNAIFLMHKGWYLWRSGTGRFIESRGWVRACWYLVNPSRCFKMVFVVVRCSVTRLSQLVEYVRDVKDGECSYAEYRLKERLA